MAAEHLPAGFCSHFTFLFSTVQYNGTYAGFAEHLIGGGSCGEISSLGELCWKVTNAVRAIFFFSSYDLMYSTPYTCGDTDTKTPIPSLSCSGVSDVKL